MNEFHKTLQVSGDELKLVDLAAVCDHFDGQIERLPYSLRVMLENTVRRGDLSAAQHIVSRHIGETISFHPARVLLQDLLGVPVMVDLSSMRDAARAKGADPAKINPQIPVDLVIDHSLIPVHVGDNGARSLNEEIEIQRNQERFAFLRWCQTAYSDVRIIPPGKGIMHQINIEYLGRGYRPDLASGWLIPDTVYGTDSHTPMVNGLGILGWGVGGLEAEMAMLGRDSALALPEVVGVRLSGESAAGVTATDVVLSITERLRKLGVVGKFVEFCGDSLDSLAAADRCTIANMAPEYGATCVYFPIDEPCLRYLRLSGRSNRHVDLVQSCAKAQQLWRAAGSRAPHFDQLVEIDLSEIVPSIAGPRRPQDRISLDRAHTNLRKEFNVDPTTDAFEVAGETFRLNHGAIVIAAITSCTNTSNPAVVIGAALLARNAHRRGLRVQPWVKTSFAPGSQVVAQYLINADLQQYLDKLGFNVVGFGCTTCNGASGPIAEAIHDTIEKHDLTCVAALSGNRNFEGRIHPDCRANYIMSPPLVVAYALTGTIAIDFRTQPVGYDPDATPVFLRELWPDDAEIDEIIDSNVRSELFTNAYASIVEGGQSWQKLEVSDEPVYEWQPESTYLRSAPFFDNVAIEPQTPVDLHDLRPLVILGDSITTDHISPSGAIIEGSAAGDYLSARGVSPVDFNTYGTRRGNHEIAMRSTFANNRLHNEMVAGTEGSFTRLMPDDKPMRVFDAATEYQARGQQLIIIAGRDYGCGSSRDTAAKCVNLLGVRAVVAESFERIHRSNLVGMGILPLQFLDGTNRLTLKLDGSETFDIVGVSTGLRQRCQLTLIVNRHDGSSATATVMARLDTADEANYIHHGGVLPFVFRDLALRPDQANGK